MTEKFESFIIIFFINIINILYKMPKFNFKLVEELSPVFLDEDRIAKASDGGVPSKEIQLYCSRCDEQFQNYKKENFELLNNFLDKSKDNRRLWTRNDELKKENEKLKKEMKGIMIEIMMMMEKEKNKKRRFKR